ncbi:MAG: transglycosylase domain-containing protein [Erysipelotrichaceae bacterium]|jgi:penicillin-binding protein 1A|nr:transglycosylase domain-containing protein [Erysipelotrichaceae bacterium]
MKKVKMDFFKNLTRKKNSNKPKEKITFKKVMLVVISTILIISVIGSVIGGIYLANILSKSPVLNLDDLISPESTRIYDMYGNKIADLGNESRENITYNELPQNLIDAFVAIEDSRYFSHIGFDLPRFAKSFINNLKTMSLSQGGSTFTMQLIDNTYFADGQKYSAIEKIERKIQEIALSIELNGQMDKKTVFALYLNMINFGAGQSRGIKYAAAYYFGKEVSELNLSESAFLAGVINAPSRYNPHKHLDWATARRNEVLDLMVRHGYITTFEADLAKSIKLEDLLVEPGTGNIIQQNTQYLAYINYVCTEVEELTGYNPYEVPMEVYTYMDPHVQETIEAIENGETSIEFRDPMQVAMVVLDNQTGQILGLGGGRGETVLRGYNRATDMYQQPGSSIKPILSYALAFEVLGWATDHVVEDKPVYIRGTNVLLTNADNAYRGQIALKDAVGISLNIPAYLALEEVADKWGTAQIVQYLQSLGFSKVTESNFDLGYSIGGSTFQVSPLELAAAHAAFINGGEYIKPHAVNYIVIKNNAPIENNPMPTQVVSAETAYLVTYLMENNVSGPYNNYMQVLKRSYPIYAKTGTTDYGKDGLQYGIPRGSAKEKWMVSSSSHYTTIVWLGFEKAAATDDPSQYTYFVTADNRKNIPGNINKLLLDAVHEGKDTPTAIERPPGIVEISHVIAMFPYTEPVEGLPVQYITTGLIDKKHYELVPFGLSGAIEPITEFTATMTSNGASNYTFNLNWGSYPNPYSNIRQIDDTHYDISLVSSGGTVISATGTLLFNPAYLYNQVLNKATIKVDGAVVATVNTSPITLTITDLNKEVIVCGYYGRDGGDRSANEICLPVGRTDVSAYDPVVTFPPAGVTGNNAASWQAWINANSLTGIWSVTTQPAANIGAVGTYTVTRGGVTLASMLQSQLDDAPTVVTIFDNSTTYTLRPTVSQTLADFAAMGLPNTYYNYNTTGGDTITNFNFSSCGPKVPGDTITFADLMSGFAINNP